MEELSEVTPYLDWTNFDAVDTPSAMNGWRLEANGSMATLVQDPDEAGNRLLRGYQDSNGNALGVLLAKQFEGLQTDSDYIFSFRIRHNGSSPRAVVIRLTVNGNPEGDYITVPPGGGWIDCHYPIKANAPQVRLGIFGGAKPGGPYESSQAWDLDDLILRSPLAADHTDFRDSIANGWSFIADQYTFIRQRPNSERWELFFNTGGGDNSGTVASKQLLVMPGTTYRFSLQAIRDNTAPAVPTLKLQMGEEPASPTVEISSNVDWVTLSGEFTSTSHTPQTSEFKVISTVATGLGNDYSITDLRIEEIQRT